MEHGLVLLTVSIPPVALYMSGKYATSGFWCNDQSLALPYRPDTVSHTLLLLASFGVPLLMMSLTECLRFVMKSKPRTFKYDILSLAKGYGVFLFGIVTTLLFTDTIKYSVGRLRPHFFDLCKPDFVKLNCTEGINRSPQPIKDDIQRITDMMTHMELSIPCGNVSYYDCLVFIHSAIPHFRRRQEFRQTYGNNEFTEPFRLKLVFLLGKTPNETLQNQIVKEHNRYSDTIQGSFTDTYHKLSYKALMGFRWASESCYDVKSVIKMDDDVLFDVHKFYREFWPLPRHQRDMLHCHGWKHPYVERHGKWAISEADYKGAEFTPYCSGFFVVIPPDAIHDIYRVGRSLPFLWIDDVFIYGIVRKRMALQFIYMDQLAFQPGQYEECIELYGNRCKYICVVMGHKKPFYKYVSDYECTNTQITHKLLRDSQLSFPSGHSSFSIYSALFTIFYLQTRLEVKVSYFFKPVIQMIIMLAALLCCVSRVKDNKHFPSDVLAGTFIGVTIAWLVFYKIAQKVIPNQETTPQHPAFKRGTSIESEPQTPTPLLRPERLVLNHYHLQQNGGFRNGQSNIIKQEV